MRRKLVQQGNSTLMISIPKKWAEQQHLNKGDELDINTTEHTLTITTEPAKTTKETTIELATSAHAEIRTHIVNAYRAGYDKITVHYTKEQTLKEVERILQTKLIGFDIVHNSKGTCTIENITEPEQQKFSIIFQKIFQNIQELINNINNNTETETTQTRILKYDNFCRRVIAKNTITYQQSLYLNLLTLLIHANREIYHASKLLPANNQERIQHYLNTCKELTQQLQTAYNKQDTKILSQLHEQERTLIFEQGYNDLRTSKEQDTIITYHLLAAMRRLYQATSPLTGILLHYSEES